MCPVFFVQEKRSVSPVNNTVMSLTVFVFIVGFCYRHQISYQLHCQGFTGFLWKLAGVVIRNTNQVYCLVEVYIEYRQY